MISLWVRIVRSTTGPLTSPTRRRADIEFAVAQRLDETILEAGGLADGGLHGDGRTVVGTGSQELTNVVPPAVRGWRPLSARTPSVVPHRRTPERSLPVRPGSALVPVAPAHSGCRRRRGG